MLRYEFLSHTAYVVVFVAGAGIRNPKSVCQRGYRVQAHVSQWDPSDKLFGDRNKIIIIIIIVVYVLLSCHCMGENIPFRHGTLLKTLPLHTHRGNNHIYPTAGHAGVFNWIIFVSETESGIVTVQI